MMVSGLYTSALLLWHNIPILIKSLLQLLVNSIEICSRKLATSIRVLKGSAYIQFRVQAEIILVPLYVKGGGREGGRRELLP